MSLFHAHPHYLIQARAKARQEAVATLKRLDLNADGVVSRDEFLVAGGTNADFDRIDLNADGGLDESELEVAARDLKRAVGNLQLKVMGFLVRASLLLRSQSVMGDGVRWAGG